MVKNLTIKFLKEEQKERLIKNTEQIQSYFLQKCENSCKDNTEYEYEKEILFLIKYSVSLKFLAQYFKVPEEHIKKIATKHRCYSQLLSNFTENVNARCFSKNQILRTCEDFNYICPMCFKPLDITKIHTLTGHHIQPFARGGKTAKDNCLPLHVNCHFDDFKLLHSALFDSADPIYSAKYFNLLKEKLKTEKSGIDYILQSNQKIFNND